MQILASQLWQLVQLCLQRIDDRFVAIPEIDRRVPHLQIKVSLIVSVIEKAAFAALEEFGYRRVVHSIPVGTVLRLFLAEFFLIHMDHW